MGADEREESAVSGGGEGTARGKTDGVSVPQRGEAAQEYDGVVRCGVEDTVDVEVEVVDTEGGGDAVDNGIVCEKGATGKVADETFVEKEVQDAVKGGEGAAVVGEETKACCAVEGVDI